MWETWVVGKIPWRRKWQPTPAFLLGEFHGQRILAGYSPGVTKSWILLSDFTFTFHRGSMPAPSSVLLKMDLQKQIWQFLLLSLGAFQMAHWLSPPATVGDSGLTSGSEVPLKEELETHSRPCLENSTDKGASWATVYRVQKNQT